MNGTCAGHCASCSVEHVLSCCSAARQRKFSSLIALSSSLLSAHLSCLPESPLQWGRETEATRSKAELPKGQSGRPTQGPRHIKDFILSSVQIILTISTTKIDSGRFSFLVLLPVESLLLLTSSMRKPTGNAMGGYDS